MKIENESINENAPDLWAQLEQQAAQVDKVLSPETLNGEIENQAEEIDESSADLMAALIDVTADIFAPNWQIQPEESQKLGMVYGALLDKYLPDSGLGKYSLEFSAVLITGAILKSRKGIPLKKPEPEEKQAAPEQIEHKKETPPTGHAVKNNMVLKPKAVKHD